MIKTSAITFLPGINRLKRADLKKNLQPIVDNFSKVALQVSPNLDNSLNVSVKPRTALVKDGAMGFGMAKLLRRLGVTSDDVGYVKEAMGWKPSKAQLSGAKEAGQWDTVQQAKQQGKNRFTHDLRDLFYQHTWASPVNTLNPKTPSVANLNRLKQQATMVQSAVNHGPWYLRQRLITQLERARPDERLTTILNKLKSQPAE